MPKEARLGTSGSCTSIAMKAQLRQRAKLVIDNAFAKHFGTAFNYYCPFITKHGSNGSKRYLDENH